MSVGPNSRTSENIRNRDLTESAWIPLTLQTSQTVISSAIKPNLFKGRQEGNNPCCEARFTAFHLRHTSTSKSEGVVYMAILVDYASAIIFCCKTNAIGKKMYSKVWVASSCAGKSPWSRWAGKSQYQVQPAMADKLFQRVHAFVLLLEARAGMPAYPHGLQTPWGSSCSLSSTAKQAQQGPGLGHSCEALLD